MKKYCLEMVILASGIRYKCSNDFQNKHTAQAILEDKYLKHKRAGREMTEKGEDYFCYIRSGLEHMIHVIENN